MDLWNIELIYYHGEIICYVYINKGAFKKFGVWTTLQNKDTRENVPIQRCLAIEYSVWNLTVLLTEKYLHRMMWAQLRTLSSQWVRSTVCLGMLKQWWWDWIGFFPIPKRDMIAHNWFKLACLYTVGSILKQGCRSLFSKLPLLTFNSHSWNGVRYWKTGCILSLEFIEKRAMKGTENSNICCVYCILWEATYSLLYGICPNLQVYFCSSTRHMAFTGWLLLKIFLVT